MNFAPFREKKIFHLEHLKCHCFYRGQILNTNCQYCVTNKHPELGCDSCDDLKDEFYKYIEHYCIACGLNICKKCILYSKCTNCGYSTKVCKKCKTSGKKCDRCNIFGCSNCLDYNDYKERRLCYHGYGCGTSFLS